MLQSLNHDSWSKKIGIKPQIGTIIMFIWRERGGMGTRCLIQFTYCAD